jgi:hypothetical protein
MSDFTVRSDNVDVEQIMGQIRARIREKRGVDYTEEEIRELANVKLEKFLDPRGVRSDLLEQFRRRRTPQPPPPNFEFGESTLFHSHRAIIRWIRALLKPILKLFFNVNPLIQALHIQAQLNARNAQLAAERENLEALQYELTHNLVIELTRVGIEVKNLKMRLESMSSRLDFDERRARALEGVVQYRPGAVPPLQPPSVSGGGAPAGGRREENQQGGPDSAERRSRRRRRRGRKRPGQPGFVPSGPGQSDHAGGTDASDDGPEFESAPESSEEASHHEPAAAAQPRAAGEPEDVRSSTSAQGATSDVEGQEPPPFER